MTTGDVYRIPTDDSTQYFVIENRQKESVHDYTGDQGVYIHHVTNAHDNLPDIDVQCAHGNWNFNFDPADTWITRTTPNPSCNDEMNYTVNYNYETYACYKPYYHENAAWGDEEDAFNLTFNNVYSPYSTPRSTNSSGTTFSPEVKDIIGDFYKTQLHFSDPLATAPSKPLNFEGTIQNGHPHVTWEGIDDPDLSFCEVHKKSGFR